MTRPLAGLARLALAAVLATGGVVATQTAFAGPLPLALSATPHPVAPGYRSVALDVTSVSGLRSMGPVSPAARGGAASSALSLPGTLDVVGVSWPRGAVTGADQVQVRVHDRGGWGAWQALPVDDSGPDAGSPEAAHAREGTGPLVTAGDFAQVRVVTASGRVLRGLRAEVIDPGTSAADASAGARPAGSAVADAVRPTILPRSTWGADESLRTSSPRYGQAHVAVIHHTVNANSYSSSQVPAILRGIYAYHVKSLGWSDIGYQVLVDRYGRAWEGRAGGLDKAVVGSQAKNFNSVSFGVSAIGDYSSVTPPQAQQDMIARVIAWKMSVHGNPASGSVDIDGRMVPRIIGHRQAPGSLTSCPGNGLYGRLPSIRAKVASLMGALTPVSGRRSWDTEAPTDLLQSSPTLTSPLGIVRAAPAAPVRPAAVVASGWNGLDRTVVTSDVTGDGKADVIARESSTGVLRVYRGDGAGHLAGYARTSSGWGAYREIVAAGDRTGNGTADLVGLRSDGLLVLAEGNGRGGFAAPRAIGTAWSGMRAVTDVGDLTRDGVRDLVAVRSSDSTFHLYAGAPGGGIASSRAISAAGWAKATALLGAVDLDGDGTVGDIVIRDASGVMRTAYGAPGRALARTNHWGRGWNGLTQLSSGADLTGDGRVDIVARRTSDAALVVYAGSGRRDFASAPVVAAVPVQGANLVRLVGDVDGDGRGDAVARDAAGVLWALKGTSTGFATPVSLGSGWGQYDLVEPAGDLTRDGVPDLLARTGTGSVRLFAFGRDLRWRWQVGLGSGFTGYDRIVGVGSVNADYNADIVALRSSDKAVLLFRGSGPGTLRDSSLALPGGTGIADIIGVGDFDGDSRNDLVVRDTAGRLGLHTGLGNGTFATYRQPLSTPALPSGAVLR